MPLPFLNNKKSIAGVIISKRKPDGGKEELHSEGNEYDGIEECMEGFKKALEAGDTKAMAQHFKDAFQISDSEPHDEGEHTNESDNSYAAQNEKAAQERR